MKRKNRIVISLLLIICLLVGSTILPTLLGTSKQTVVRSSLKWALVHNRLPDINLIGKDKGFILSLDNIEGASIPKFDGITITCMKQSDIMELANRQGDFLYLRFKSIKVGWFESTVVLENAWAKSENSTTGYLSGGGFSRTYYNILGFWIPSGKNSMWIA